MVPFLNRCAYCCHTTTLVLRYHWWIHNSTLSCSYTVGGETCVSSCITGCSTKDGQRRCGGGTTTVFVGVGIDSLDVPTVQVQQPSYSVTTGNTVTLVCTVSSSLPITSVQWQRNVNGGITTINSNTNTNKYSGKIMTTIFGIPHV
jgi:hypothetical protein